MHLGIPSVKLTVRDPWVRPDFAGEGEPMDQECGGVAERWGNGTGERGYS